MWSEKKSKPFWLAAVFVSFTYLNLLYLQVTILYCFSKFIRHFRRMDHAWDFASNDFLCIMHKNKTKLLFQFHCSFVGFAKYEFATENNYRWFTILIRRGLDVRYYKRTSLLYLAETISNQVQTFILHVFVQFHFLRIIIKTIML